MKIKLLFLLLVLIINIGWSQNVMGQLQDIGSESGLEYRMVLLDDNSSLVSKIVADYNLDQEADFVISPNPAINKLNIKLLSVNDNVKLEVFDVLGKLIYKREITQLESSVNISNWKIGVYLVRISNNKMTQTKRFLKQ
ncbi:MAG: T9SS type A sorting domain-containing protein [Winogradskyella sp.]|nr:T9SS type A sorting domain-containing protein [Winogradskyella sp.]